MSFDLEDYSEDYSSVIRVICSARDETKQAALRYRRYAWASGFERTGKLRVP